MSETNETNPANAESDPERLVMHEPHCQWCGMPCEVMQYRFGGHISQCHGCGVGYENAAGELVFENDDLSYDKSWDE